MSDLLKTFLEIISANSEKFYYSLTNYNFIKSEIECDSTMQYRLEYSLSSLNVYSIRFNDSVRLFKLKFGSAI